MARAAGDNCGRDERSDSQQRRRRIAGVAAALMLGLVASPVARAALDELKFFRIGTAATTGTYFQIGGVLASAISKPSGSRDCDHGGSCGVARLVAGAHGQPVFGPERARGQRRPARIRACPGRYRLLGLYRRLARRASLRHRQGRRGGAERWDAAAQEPRAPQEPARDRRALPRGCPCRGPGRQRDPQPARPQGQACCPGRARIRHTYRCAHRDRGSGSQPMRGETLGSPSLLGSLPAGATAHRCPRLRRRRNSASSPRRALLSRGRAAAAQRVVSPSMGSPAPPHGVSRLTARQTAGEHRKIDKGARRGIMGALVSRLARWLDPIRDLFWTLGPTRFSVIVVLVIGVGLAGTDQMQDVLLALAEDANPVGVAGFYAALSWWAFNVFYGARFILDRELRPLPRRPDAAASKARIACFITYVPRALGLAAFAAVAIALACARAWALSAATIVIGGAFGYVFFWRRRWLLRQMYRFTGRRGFHVPSEQAAHPDGGAEPGRPSDASPTAPRRRAGLRGDPPR